MQSNHNGNFSPKFWPLVQQGDIVVIHAGLMTIQWYWQLGLSVPLNTVGIISIVLGGMVTCEAV